MITGELKNKVDGIWDTIWAGGITSPITVLEQITYLMFMKLLDDNQIKKKQMQMHLVSRSRTRFLEMVSALSVRSPA